MQDKINLVIVDDHQSIIDGYLYRLAAADDIEVVATLQYGNDLLPTLAHQPVDVVLLDIAMPSSAADSTPFPVVSTVPKLLQARPDLAIVIITMYAQRTLIQGLVDNGVVGYILKDDAHSLRNLANVVRAVHRGELHFSPFVGEVLSKAAPSELAHLTLTERQKAVLAMCAAFPEESLDDLAARMCLAAPSLRTSLSRIYLKLNVRGREAAVAKVRQAGLLPPYPGDPEVT